MTRPVRIPSDVHRPDRVVGPFTARQAAILAGTAAALYLLWTLAREVVAATVFLAGAVPVAVFAVVIALGQRHGLSMDRLLVAAVRHRLNPPASDPHRTYPTDISPDGDPERDEVPGWITARTTSLAEPSPARGRRLSEFPARTVTPVPVGPAPDGVGVVDLGADGLVVIAVVSTVNFGLRTPAEQDGLVAGFARYLHGLGGPVQILIRALPVDLHAHLQLLRTQIRELPHPALAAAAHDHLGYLARLAHRRGDDQLLTRQVLLVLRDPHRADGPRQAGRRQPAQGQPGAGGGTHRLLRRLHDAATLLAPLDVTVTALNAAQTTALLTNTCNPDRPDTSPAVGGGDDDTRDDDRVVRATSPAGSDDFNRYDESRVGFAGYPYDPDTDNPNTYDSETEGGETADSGAIGHTSNYRSVQDADHDTGHVEVGDDPSDGDWASGEDWGAEQWAVAPARQRAPARAGRPTGGSAVSGTSGTAPRRSR